ncbi:MAG: DNA polymerase III subunit delta [Candidatus Omnitrophota bacterium]|nr:DNA polymerase III subunit delta [Candidatus Omnitrophota bacterium]
MSENFLIIGEDEYIKETEISRIRDKFLSSGEADLNYSVHLPDDINGIMDSLGTVPFLADKRVVLVKEAQKLPDEFAATILSYLEKPSENSVLVLSSSGSLRKAGYYSKLSRVVKVVKADKPKPVMLGKWIRIFFTKENIAISNQAVELIVELKGEDTAGMRTELEKLVSFSGGEKIEVEHVEKLVGRSVKEAVFKLVDAVNTRDAKWAFRVLNDLYARKKRPEETVGYLAWYLRMMQKVVLLSKRGADPEGMAAELGLQPWRAGKFIQQAKKYPVDRIERWLELLLETDRDIKTGRRKPTLALEMLVVQLFDG